MQHATAVFGCGHSGSDLSLTQPLGFFMQTRMLSTACCQDLYTKLGQVTGLAAQPLGSNTCSDYSVWSSLWLFKMILGSNQLSLRCVDLYCSSQGLAHTTV